jgi:hypothetical protein
VYLPTADLVSNQLVPDPGPLQPETITMGQETSVALGLRASRTLSSKVWVEAELLFAPSTITIVGTRQEPADRPTQTKDARVIAFGANILYELFRAPFTPFAIHALGGLALVNRGGEFFDEGGGLFPAIEGGTDVAAILGLGARYGFSPKLGLRLDIRDYISSYAQKMPGGTLDSELQNDIWITLGLEITL